MSSETPEVEKLFKKIQACLPLAIKFKKPAFRFCSPEYASKEEFASGHGASYYGGRFNPKGITAVYGSLDPHTAVDETYQTHLKYGFSSAPIRPKVLGGLDINIKRAMDLTDSHVLRRIGFTRVDLIEEDWQAIQEAGEESWTQTIGRGAVIHGFEGLIVPSAVATSGKNIVVFPSNLLPGSWCKVMSPEDLPPPPSNWPA